MKLTVLSSDRGIARMVCEGVITAGHGQMQTNPMEQALGPGCYGFRVLLNLEKATAIESNGVAWLVRCNKNFQDGGGQLVLYGVPPAIAHVLTLLNMHLHLNLAGDEDEAVELLRGAGA